MNLLKGLKKCNFSYDLIIKTEKQELFKYKTNFMKNLGSELEDQLHQNFEYYNNNSNDLTIIDFSFENNILTILILESNLQVYSQKTINALIKLSLEYIINFLIAIQKEHYNDYNYCLLERDILNFKYHSDKIDDSLVRI